MRVLGIHDAAQTGFGRVGRSLSRLFLNAGHEVRIIGINHRGRDGEIAAMLQRGAAIADVKARLDEMEADPLEKVIIPAFAGGDGQGWSLTGHAVHGRINQVGWLGWKPEVVLCVADPRAMLNRLANDGGSLSTLPVFNYVPIEGVALPPAWQHIWEKVHPVAMTDMGRAELQTLLGRTVPVAYHGVSADFYPVSVTRPGFRKGQPITSKDAAKQAFDMAGRTVLLRTDRFAKRKDYPGLLRSMAPILQRHPEVLLVLHCAIEDDGGLLIEHLSRMSGAFHQGNSWAHPQVRITQAHDTFRGLSDADLNVLYNAADVYVSPTMAEGFGLTLVEAAACGVPVVTTDYAAGPEVVGPGAMLVPIRDRWTNEYALDWGLVDEGKFTEATEYLIEHPKRRRELGDAGRRHVARYTWEACSDVFLGLFENTVAQRLAT